MRKGQEQKEILELADFFKVLGDQTRLNILLILVEKEMCVQDIADIVGISQSAISHQLRVLKQARLVKFRREGKTMHYSLDDEHVEEILKKGSAHIVE